MTPQAFQLRREAHCEARLQSAEPRIAAMERAAVVVDVGWVNGLAAVRSLGRAGLRVLALDQRSSALGFRSRYAEARLCPDPLADEDRFIEFLRDVGEELGGPTPVF